MSKVVTTDILWAYHHDVGPLVPSAAPLVRRNAAFRRFVDFLRPDWDRVRDLCRRAMSGGGSDIGANPLTIFDLPNTNTAARL